MLYRDRKRFNEKITKAGDYYLNRLPARLGNYSQIVAVPDKSGYVYARLENSGQVIEALNVTAPAIYDLPVFIGRDKSQPSVVKVLEVRWIYAAGAILSFIAYHARQHIYPGPDVVWVMRDQFMPLLVLPAGDFNVRLFGDMIYANGMTKPIKVANADLDLSSYASATVGARYVLLEVLPDGTLNYIEGDDAGSKAALELVGVIPSPSDNAFPICAFEFYLGQTELRRDSTERTIIDLRMFTSDTSSSAGEQIHAAATDTPLDADEWGFWDVVDSALKKITWANIKATLTTYFDTLYSALGHTHDAADVTYTPADVNNWDYLADPGDVQEALDQLAARIRDLESLP